MESDLVYMYIYSKLDILDFYIFLVLDQPSLIPVFCFLFLSCLGNRWKNGECYFFFVLFWVFFPLFSMEVYEPYKP